MYPRKIAFSKDGTLKLGREYQQDIIINARALLHRRVEGAGDR